MDVKKSLTFLKSQAELIGLDIGSWSVKAVSLGKHGSRYSLKAMGYAPIEPPAGDTPAPDDSVIQAIRTCLQDVRGNEIGSVCGLGGEHVVIRPFSFPPLPEAEIAGAVRLEATQVCPFGVKDTSVDYQVLEVTSATEGATDAEEGEDPSLTGILTVATNRAIQHKSRLAAQAGTVCRLMDIDGLALLNAVSELQGPTNGETLALLNVGHSFSTMVIARDGTLPFVRDISFAGQAVTDIICQETDLSSEQASLALRGETQGKPVNPAVQVAAGTACAELASKVNETLRFYTTQHVRNQVRKVYLCGGFPLQARLVKLLEQNLRGYEVLPWDPFASLDTTMLNSKSDLLDQGPLFAVAVGLAMRTL
ncbi:type IV pilus assembly protein PilM [Planctomycetota bacterium]